MEQRSEEWFEARKGRFTASQINRLLGKEGLKKTNDSINNYAFEKAVETLHGVEEDAIISFDMQRGINLEPLAFALFKDIKSYNFIDVKESTFIPYGKHSGSSPDGEPSDNSILEIKCPKRNKFFKLVANGIEEIDQVYIAQMNLQMLSTGTEKGYFFNYLIEKGFEYWHEIIVQRDEKLIDLMKERINIATEIKLNYIEKLNNNRQF